MFVLTSFASFNAYPQLQSLPKLAALRSQPVANCQPETPVTPTINAPTLTLLPKKRPIQKVAGEGTSKAAARSFRRRSQRIVAIGRTFFQLSEKQEVIAVSSDSDPKPEMVKEVEEVEEDPEEDPVEAPQGIGIEEEDEEDPEEDPIEENVAEDGVRKEDDFADYWALVRSDSENSVGNDYRFTGNSGPANSSAGSCTGPLPANH
ncbi:hypothetical protein PIB30_098174 [Stylosanthes scabra]|uniref:Uncharacterized protein n=1 Tax=Stylosanthes scabra TaxID=79078 RepID=A0ABU6RWS4_9FABA|nr:hypothetical protein [Stylosanthes scabra]